MTTAAETQEFRIPRLDSDWVRNRRTGKPQAVVEVDGLPFWLRWANGHLYFRSTRPGEDDRVFFIEIPVGWDSYAPDEQENHFRERYQQGDYGRSVLPKETWDDNVFFLRRDGSGWQEDDYGKVEFQWGDLAEQQHLDPWGASNLQLWEFIMFQVWKDRIYPFLPNPPISASEDLPSQEIEFICGSREELERITRVICYTEPTLFRDGGDVEVSYTAAGPDSQGGVGTYWWPEGTPPRAKELCMLAFEYNTFTGYHWEYNDQGSPDHLRAFSPYSAEIEVTVTAPSAHERAEALLELAEWLEGKVTPAEKRDYLGISRPS